MKSVDLKQCTGCSACACACPTNSIRMLPDGDGFLSPVTTAETCIGCGLCEASCPLFHPPAVPEGIPTAYAAYSKNVSFRAAGSSGGIFPELAAQVLAKQGAVFGAAYDAQFHVQHICAETSEVVAALCGAKYAQSNINGTFPAVKARLKSGQNVLFVGTPCQVAGLKAFLKREYENLLCVDFVCHSVPSPLAWQEFLACQAQQDKSASPLRRVTMRAKCSGWSHYSYSNRFEYADGTEKTVKSGESLFMKLFVAGCISRPACQSCRFRGYSKCSDLTLGDFWGIWDIAPELDDNGGTSLLLCHSARGAQWLEQLTGRLVIKQVAPEETSRQNPRMLTASAPHPRREEVMELIRAGRFSSLAAWFPPEEATPARKRRSAAIRLWPKHAQKKHE